MINFRKSSIFAKGLNTTDIPDIFQSNPAFSGDTASRLRETQNFGSNPGQLRMFSYTPARSMKPSALVVVLHGCGQTAADYDHGAGWTTLADRYGFSVLMPQQQRSNNPNGCFNWFQPGDAGRDQGEAASIHQMVEAMRRGSGVDRQRIFITGLSAGGAMTSVMLACYPETFAAGAIIAGLPFGAASNVQEALKSMYQCPPQEAKHWGDRVRAAAPTHVRSWPRISVWHGSADKTVVPSNAREIIKQWTDVHGLSDAPSTKDRVRGYPRQVWLDDAGEEILESYTITHMAHGTPLATRGADGYGAAGPFLLDVGISSSLHIARFFGLTGELDLSDETLAPARSSTRLLEPEALQFSGSRDARKERGTTSPIDVAAVITAALTKAGLLKRD